MLSLRLFHRQFPEVFRGSSGLCSRIKSIGGIELEDGAIWESGNRVRKRRDAVVKRARLRLGRERGRESGGWLPAAVGLERDWVVEVKQVEL